MRTHILTGVTANVLFQGVYFIFMSVIPSLALSIVFASGFAIWYSVLVSLSKADAYLP